MNYFFISPVALESIIHYNERGGGAFRRPRRLTSALSSFSLAVVEHLCIFKAVVFCAKLNCVPLFFGAAVVYRLQRFTIGEGAFGNCRNAVLNGHTLEYGAPCENVRAYGRNSFAYSDFLKRTAVGECSLANKCYAVRNSHILKRIAVIKSKTLNGLDSLGNGHVL